MVPSEPLSTIVAIATGPAAGGVGIVRLSGPLALSAARPLAPEAPVSPEPRRAYFTSFVDALGRAMDRGLFLFFPAPHSVTGEDVVEFHAHGSPRLLSWLVERLLGVSGVRPAEPGEFTRRAYLNGRIDLARAEAVADLVAATSEAAVRAAAAQAAGALSARVRSLREPLVELRAELEGALEFPEEVAAVDAALASRLESLSAGAEALAHDIGRGRLARRGARVVLYGPANAGKSTLFNRLLGEERALVDAEPGTTRDAVEARLEIGGLAVTLVDTAGLREGDGPGRVEALGIARTLAELKQADLAVLLLPPGAGEGAARRWTAEAKKVEVLRVAAKADLGTAGACGLAVSGQTGAGIDGLRRELTARLTGGGIAEAALGASERHQDAVRRAAEALARGRAARAAGALEVVAGELGLAAEALGEVTGETASAEVVDAIFRAFCLGK